MVWDSAIGGAAVLRYEYAAAKGSFQVGGQGAVEW